MKIVNINGWKWDNKEDFQTASKKGNEYFGFPIIGNVTTTCMEALENRNSIGVILFYYVAYNFQFEPFLGKPFNFDVNIPSNEL